MTVLIALIVIIGIVVMIISSSDDAKQLHKNGVVIEADYVRCELMSVTMKDKKPEGLFILECSYTDSSGKAYVYRSRYFPGSSLFYNHSKIKVLVDPKDAANNYEVDLSYLSTEDKEGLVMLETFVELEKIVFERDGELLWQRDQPDSASARTGKTLDSIAKLAPEKIISRYLKSKKQND